MTTTLTRPALIRRASREVIVITRNTSRDMLIAHMNFMRNNLNLEPIRIDTNLNKKAEIEALAITRGARVALDPDRSPFSVTTTDALSWVRPIMHEGDSWEIQTSVHHTTNYARCILNQHCTSVGIYVWDDGTAHAIAIQIFRIESS